MVTAATPACPSRFRHRLLNVIKADREREDRTSRFIELRGVGFTVRQHSDQAVAGDDQLAEIASRGLAINDKVHVDGEPHVDWLMAGLGRRIHQQHWSVVVAVLIANLSRSSSRRTGGAQDLGIGHGQQAPNYSSRGRQPTKAGVSGSSGILARDWPTDAIFVGVSAFRPFGDFGVRCATTRAAGARTPKIGSVRRESSTVVGLIGETGDGLLAGLVRSPNVTVARAPAETDQASSQHGGGWEPGALAMREAARRRSTYVIVPEDPLANVAASWQAMWQVPAGPDAAVHFEEQAAERAGRLAEQAVRVPDYYLIVAPAQPEEGAAPDLYLGPLRAVRPHRVAVAAVTQEPAQPAEIIRVLRSLGHGPWWPPLDDLLGAVRQFFPSVT